MPWRLAQKLGLLKSKRGRNWIYNKNILCPFLTWMWQTPHYFYLMLIGSHQISLYTKITEIQKEHKNSKSVWQVNRSRQVVYSIDCLIHKLLWNWSCYYGERQTKTKVRPYWTIESSLGLNLLTKPMASRLAGMLTSIHVHERHPNICVLYWQSSFIYTKHESN